MLFFYWLRKKKGVNPETDFLSFKALVSRWWKKQFRSSKGPDVLVFSLF